MIQAPIRTPSASRRTIAASSMVACVIALAAPDARAELVLTDTTRVHRCLPVVADSATDGPSASVFATTDGGLVQIASDGRLHGVWTSLDGLAGTRSHGLLRDADTLWIGGEDGLTKATLSGSKLRIGARYESVKSAPVRTILRHRGSLYAGTWGAGLQRLRGARLQSVPAPADDLAASRRITALATHNGALIAATAGRGLYELRDGTLRPMALPGLERAMVWSLLARGDTLWIGTVSGLYAVTGSAAQVRRIADGDIRGLSATGADLMAATFGQGVQRIRDAGLEPLPDAPTKTSFAYGYAADSGAACIAGHAGLWLRTDTTRWTAAATGGLPSGDISALASQRVDGPNGAHQRVWIGTFDSGLAVFEAGAVQRFEHPRIDPKINALAVAEGKIWVGTSAGLSIVELAKHGSLAGAQVTRIDKRDGLPSSFIMALRPLRGGGMLVGTARGAAAIRGDTIWVIGRKLGIYISNVWSVNQDADGSLLLGTTKGLYRVQADGAWQRFSVASGHLLDDWVMAIERVDDSWWVGTYKGGVSKLQPIATLAGDATTDTQARVAIEHAARSAQHLGGGFINPSGLFWHDGTLHAATMDGMLTGDGDSWRPAEQAGTGRDTTGFAAVASGPGAGLWIATRRGIRVR